MLNSIGEMKSGGIDVLVSSGGGGGKLGSQINFGCSGRATVELFPFTVVIFHPIPPVPVLQLGVGVLGLFRL
jgi:hypothetical protein